MCGFWQREGWLESLSSFYHSFANHLSFIKIYHSFANHLLLFLETSDAPNMKTEVLIKWRIIGKAHPRQTPSIIIIIIAPEKFMLFNFQFLLSISWLILPSLTFHFFLNFSQLSDIFFWLPASSPLYKFYTFLNNLFELNYTFFSQSISFLDTHVSLAPTHFCLSVRR